jgi:ferrous iron transport protein B
MGEITAAHEAAYPNVPHRDWIAMRLLEGDPRITGVGEQRAGVMFETSQNSTLAMLLRGGGWTTLAAVCLMLFSLCHNPCPTTIFTIWKETKNAKLTALATLLPIGFGVIVCGAVAWIWHWLA